LKAYEIDTTNAEIKINLAEYYTKTNKIVEAEKLCKEAIIHEPNSSDAHYTLGRVF